MIDMKLQITHVRGQIGINSNNAEMSIRQPKADLEITTQKPEINAQNSQARVKIDQSQCFSEAGLKDVFELTEEYAQRGMAAAIEAIGNTVDEGNRMAMIQNKADAFAEIAASKALPPPADFNITLMPRSRPKIDFEGGIFFYPEMGVVNINFNPNPPEVEASWGSIEFYLLQRPYFRFEFAGNNIDVSV